MTIKNILLFSIPFIYFILICVLGVFVGFVEALMLGLLFLWLGGMGVWIGWLLVHTFGD